MSLNQFMHPRNPYKKAPDFKELAAQYPEFNEHITIDEKGSFFNNTSENIKINLEKWSVTVLLQ